MDAGINLIDTGDVYAEGEGERVIGRTLKASGRRHEVLIATKVDHGRGRSVRRSRTSPTRSGPTSTATRGST